MLYFDFGGGRLDPEGAAVALLLDPFSGSAIDKGNYMSKELNQKGR